MEFLYHTLGAAAQSPADNWIGPDKEYGERAYRVKGRDVDVVHLDVGNSWSGIISVIPHDGDESHIVAFWNRLMDIVEEEGEE